MNCTNCNPTLFANYTRHLLSCLTCQQAGSILCSTGTSLRNEYEESRPGAIEAKQKEEERKAKNA